MWTLKVDEPCPGLCPETAPTLAKLLSLDRLAAPGRCDRDAFTSQTLLGFERFRNSVRATFAPPSWAGLQVRASWSIGAHDAVDLEVSVSATSVGELDGLEIGVGSQVGPAPPAGTGVPVSYIRARDAAVALSSYDGRDPGPVVHQLGVRSRTQALRPSLFAWPEGPEDLFYAEMAHPNDVARTISAAPIPDGPAIVTVRSTQFALFGLALEKGVILRARLRGCWIRSKTPGQDVAGLYQEFLREPLPLGS
jgi:hypothetical protein